MFVTFNIAKNVGKIINNLSYAFVIEKNYGTVMKIKEVETGKYTVI
ncbi:hypothetical protein CSCA_2471 [Clostridium scatologenes]|uniref:Uncharacterized protein n=1 Tax=Clostridium scatologenes TaxID=1548 RepID=A0A0E3GR28_CLOSL|nr:hypothetical protein CSCA_2471 [Clostridium scatologenes]